MSHQNSKGAVASVYPYGIVNHHNKPEEHKEEHPDTMPSDYQPPGVDAVSYTHLTLPTIYSV